MRLDQPTPASLVGRWVDTPPVVFKTRGDAYRGKLVSIDTARAKHVVVRFQDSPKTTYFFSSYGSGKVVSGSERPSP
jgi:hypothetical protein